MSNSDTSVGPFYEGWQIYNERIVEVVRDSVFGEPGAETTPISDPRSAIGWEDDLDRPRTAAELTEALETSWRIISGCLQRWTPDLLFEQFEPQANKKTQVHTRQSVLMRLLSHDAYYSGDLSQTLGIHGSPQIDLWRPD